MIGPSQALCLSVDGRARGLTPVMTTRPQLGKLSLSCKSSHFLDSSLCPDLSNPAAGAIDDRLFIQIQDRLLFLCFAEKRRLGQGEEHHFFARKGADVVVHAQHLDAGDLLDHRLHDRPRRFD
jgi:hypothetical protein